MKIQERISVGKLPEVDKVVGDANTAEDGLNACDRYPMATKMSIAFSNLCPFYVVS